MPKNTEFSAWRKSMDLAAFAMSRNGQTTEPISNNHITQLRNSALSASSNLAEGCGNAATASQVNHSVQLASEYLTEFQRHLEALKDQQYLNPQEYQDLITKKQEVDALLSMLRQSNQA